MSRDLSEAIETIVGDLCRAESGQFSSCEGGTATAEADPPDHGGSTAVAEGRPKVRGPEHLTESTRAKTARREPGKGGPVALTLDELEDVVEHGVYGIIGSGPSPAERETAGFVWSPEQEAARQTKIHEDLAAKGYVFTDGEGRYGAPERTTLVLAPEIELADLDDLGEKHGQESVVYVGPDGSNQLRFTTGPNKGKRHTGDGFVALPSSTETDYSDFLSSDGRHFKFTLNFDWSKLHEHLLRFVSELRETARARTPNRYKGLHASSASSRSSDRGRLPRRPGL